MHYILDVIEEAKSAAHYLKDRLIFYYLKVFEKKQLDFVSISFLVNDWIKLIT